MLFNDDLLDVISEVQTGFTIPTALTESDMYKYFTTAKYNRAKINVALFVRKAIDDAALLDYACSTLETARWFNDVIIFYEFPLCIYNRSTRIDVFIRLALAVDRLDLVQSYLDGYDNFYNPDIIFTYATIDQLKWLIATNAKYLYINVNTVKRRIGRLFVMKLLYEYDPELFVHVKYRCTLNELCYENVYGSRSLETVEWLINTLKLKFTKKEIEFAAKFYSIPDFYSRDGSILHWILLHHTDLAIDINGVKMK